MKKNKSGSSLNVIARRIDTLIFAGFATGLLVVVLLLGFAIFNHAIQL